jgi:hypothetical protein
MSVRKPHNERTISTYCYQCVAGPDLMTVRVEDRGVEVLFAVAGIMVSAAGWTLKFIMITRAAYNQGFALDHTPVRGSGLPGGHVKPGWA